MGSGRWSLSLAIVLASMCIGGNAVPGVAPRDSIVLVHVEGPASAELAVAIANALPDGLRAADRASFSTALGSGIARALTGNKRERTKGRAAVVRAARNSGAAAGLVAITHEDKGRTRTVALVIVDARSGAVLIERDLAAADVPGAASDALEPLAASLRRAPSSELGSARSDF
jgi:hypothetical protein